jgi:hypothetical protein
MPLRHFFGPLPKQERVQHEVGGQAATFSWVRNCGCQRRNTSSNWSFNTWCGSAAIGVRLLASIASVASSPKAAVPQRDIALIGGQGWLSVPMAFSDGDGSFNVTNIANLPAPADVERSAFKGVADLHVLPLLLASHGDVLREVREETSKVRFAESAAALQRYDDLVNHATPKDTGSNGT